MSALDIAAGIAKQRGKIQRFVPVIATGSLLVVLYLIGFAQYTAFNDPQVLLNLVIDNGVLLVVAVGMTFVILSGGIDLSVGSVVAMTAMICAKLLEKGLPAWLVLIIALSGGPLLGLLMGCMIQYFNVQPFIATLAGMFLARGTVTWISKSSVSITDPFWRNIAESKVPIGGDHLTWSAILALGVTAVAVYVLAFTKFGRNVYAVGGNQQSALLMGLPVARTKVLVYVVSGLCSAIGGILWSFLTLSGAPLLAVGLELDAIAAVVIGGTLLTGGYGYVAGTLLGVMVLGLIHTLIVFDGTLNSWWQKIVVGAMLFGFILLQRLIGVRRR